MKLIKHVIISMSLFATFDVSANLISVDFSGGEDSVQYVFKAQSTIGAYFDGTEFVAWDHTFESATMTIAGTTSYYDASNADFQRFEFFENGDVTSLNLLNPAADYISGPNPVVAPEDLFSSIVFQGYFGFSHSTGFVEMVTNGDNIYYSAADFEVLSNPVYLDYLARGEQGSNVFFDKLTVSTVPSAVPVPAALWLFVLGFIGLLAVSVRQGRSNK